MACECVNTQPISKFGRESQVISGKSSAVSENNKTPAGRVLPGFCLGPHYKTKEGLPGRSFFFALSSFLQ